MKTSTMDKKNKPYGIIFWILIWQALSLMIGQEILLASPVSVTQKIVENLPNPLFWKAISFSLSRIITGFILGTGAGILLAIGSHKSKYLREVIRPLVSVIKSTPVASFIILMLIWIPSKNLSIVISMLMVLPVIYSSVLAGIENTDPKLLEMAQVFAMAKTKKLRFIYTPEVFPYFRSACSVALGLAWKSGIAAEVIGIPKGSIGEGLYEAKIYLATDELFAWTIVTIGLSVFLEKAVLRLLDKINQWNMEG